MVNLSKRGLPHFIAEVPVVNRLEGTKEEGQVIGTAKVEKLRSGGLVYHMTLSGQTAEDIRRGYSFGSFSIAEETDAHG